MKKHILLFIFLLSSALAYATRFGPYPLNQTVEKPEGYAKVVCFSVPEYITASVHLINVDTQEDIYLSTSSSYIPQWYYFIPSGTYEIASLTTPAAYVKINGFNVEVGDEVIFTSGGSMIAYPED